MYSIGPFTITVHLRYLHGYINTPSDFLYNYSSIYLFHWQKNTTCITGLASLCYHNSPTACVSRVFSYILLHAQVNKSKLIPVTHCLLKILAWISLPTYLVFLQHQMFISMLWVNKLIKCTKDWHWKVFIIDHGFEPRSAWTQWSDPNHFYLKITLFHTRVFNILPWNDANMYGVPETGGAWYRNPNSEYPQATLFTLICSRWVPNYATVPWSM